MIALERHCGWLLRAYPGWYRAERGEEVLTTLLETTRPGAQWPSPRDTRALIKGGLTVRAWGNQRLSTAANLRLAALLGAAMAVLWYFASDLISHLQILAYAKPPAANSADVGHQVTGDVLALAAVAAAWLAPQFVALALALASAAEWGFFVDPAVAVQRAYLLVAVVLLMSFRPRLPRAWLGLAFTVPVAWMLVLVTAARVPHALFSLIVTPLVLAPWIILAAVAAWAVVDARPLIAIAIWVASSCLPDPALHSSPYLGAFITLQWYQPATGAAALLAMAIWRLRRQAVL